MSAPLNKKELTRTMVTNKQLKIAKTTVNGLKYNFRHTGAAAGSNEAQFGSLTVDHFV